MTKANSRKITKVKPPAIIKVFEGTIGEKKYLICATNALLTLMLDITGKSPKKEATAKGWVIVARREAHPEAVKICKKAWTVASLSK